MRPFLAAMARDENDWQAACDLSVKRIELTKEESARLPSVASQGRSGRVAEPLCSFLL